MPRGNVSESIATLIDEWPELSLNSAGHLDANGCMFVKTAGDNEVASPTSLPSIAHLGAIYFLVPSDAEIREQWERYTVISDPAVLCDGVAFDPGINDWPDDAAIEQAIEKFGAAVMNAGWAREARALLEKERNPDAGLYASAVRIDEAAPMLIEGLMRERGVSVIYGDFDEFKTTLILDMMAHVAAGTPWQGREVMARPVIWYALEGADEIPIRLRALEAKFKGLDLPWGDDLLPITVRDRIPDVPREWRAEISRITEQWEKVCDARERLAEMPTGTERGGKDAYQSVRYSLPDLVERPPVVVIDTLSMALGGEDEKGPRAVGFIQDCIDLLKARPDFGSPDEDEDADAFAEWKAKYPNETAYMKFPAAAHVIIIHHQTKTGTDFAGHRAIAANTHGLYRVHRFGNMSDAERPYAGQLTPYRVKGIPRPSPIRFDVEIVPVEGTRRTAAILKDRATALPKELAPAIAALSDLPDWDQITVADLNECLDVVATKGAKDGAAKRKARQRTRGKLEIAGVLEAVEDDSGKLLCYRFHG